MSVRTDRVDLILTINNAKSAKTLQDMERSARDLRRALAKMDVDDDGFKKAAKEATALDARIKSVKQSMVAARNDSSSFGATFLKISAAAAAAFAVVRGFFGALSGSQKMEQLNIAFETFLGNADDAKRVVADLRKFADLTPFEVEPVNNAGRALLAFGFSAEELIPTLTMVGDVASGTGKDFNELALIYGKARAEGLIQNDTLNQLAEAGIPIYQELAKVLGVTEGEIRKLAEKGKIGFTDLQQVFKNLTTDGGRFAGLMERQSKSLEGLFSTLTSAISGRLTSAMNNLLPAIKELTSGFISFLTIPLSETLEKERQSFNGLTVQVLNANVGSKERTSLVNGLIRQYPQYLKGVAAEKATNEQLAPLLDKINKSYIVRIALQKQQEKIQPLLEREANASLDLAEKRTKYNIELAKGAELAGVNLAAITGEQEQIKAVTAALERKVAAQGRNFSFSASEEAIALNRIKSQAALNLAVEQQANASSRVNDAEREKLAVAEELKKTYGDLVDLVQNAGVPGAGTGDDNGNGGGSAAKKAKEEAEAAAGSLAFLRAEISKVQKEIENTPGQSRALEPLIIQLKTAEAALKALEDRIAGLKNPTGDIAPTAAEIAAQLGSGTERITPGATDADRLAILDFNDFVLEEGMLTAEELAAFQLSLSKAKSAEELAELQKGEEDRRKQIKDAAISSASSVAGAVIQIRQNAINEEANAAISALDTEYAAKRKAAEGNQQALDRLNKQYEVKKAAIEKEAAEKRRRTALIEATIAAALAVVKALPNPIAAIAAGVAGAAQLAVIASSKFAGGGYTGPGDRRIGPDETGHLPVGVVHANEWVSPPWMTKHPVWGPHVAALENVRRRGFADGGYTTTPTVSLTPIASSASGSADASLEAFQMLASEFRSFRADINSWQSSLNVSYLSIEQAGSDLSTVRVDSGI